MIPSGIDVAGMALSAIGTTAVDLYRCTGRTTNAIGLDVTDFADPVVVRGSWQPVPRQAYQALGLDLQKVYVVFVTKTTMADIGRDTSGDQVAYMGRRYQVESATAWGETAGFAKYLLVILPLEGGAP